MDDKKVLIRLQTGIKDLRRLCYLQQQYQQRKLGWDLQ